MSTHPQVILVVEDEQAYVDALTQGLGREGFTVYSARTVAEALAAFTRVKPALVLLDLMLPGGSGLDVCREIRRSSDVPIIMVTAKDSETDKIVGLELGADDYLTKPYSLRELAARIRSVLRRAHSTGLRSEVLRAGGLALDVSRHTVHLHGEELALPLREFELLEALMSNLGRAVPRATLLGQVWGYDFVGESKTLDVHIQRLRSRIEADPAHPRFITTVRGVGYRFEDVPDTATAPPLTIPRTGDPV